MFDWLPDSSLWLPTLLDTLAFGGKAGIVFLAVVASAIVLLLLRRGGGDAQPHLEVKQVNHRFDGLADVLRHEALDPKDYKRQAKAKAKEAKAEAKKKKPDDERRPKVFVLDFKGDIMASAVDHLRHEITAIVAVAEPGDEVVVRIESPGGVVHGYGLAASQLARIKEKKIRLVACVDKVAASGGYMMACVADEIVAAPFAILGSIGVAAEVPNVHRLLNKNGVDFHEMTAGEYKRTVSVFGEITDKGRAKFQEQLEETHGLFKDFVATHRPDLDLAQVATGEYWHGTRAKELGLLDQLSTSDDYLMARKDEARILELHYRRPKGWKDRLAGGAAEAVEQALLKIWSRLETARFG